ncbi:MAG: hypothetical protein HYW01_12460 [Deltaproteobacteria bacterium]|nr:hypothetical protein [Deltaproteobacteria bacterium]
MLRSKTVIKLFVFPFIWIMITNCAQMRSPLIENDSVFYPLLYTQYFPKEIARVEKILKYHPDPSMRVMAHLQLVLLYTNYKNPNPDYLRALEELKTYMALDPDGGKTEEVQNMLALLCEMEKTVKENEEMKRSIRLLTEQNQQIKKTIQELKDLDLQIEEKRRKIK